MLTRSNLLLLALMATASAQVTSYNSFGPNDSYQNAATGIGANPFAIRFVSSVAGDLNSISLALLLPEDNDSPTTLYLSLIADDGGLPVGSVLESWSGLSLIGPSGIFTITSHDHSYITVDTSYWLVATTPAPFLGWYTGEVVGNATVYNPYRENWNPAFATTLPAFSVAVMTAAVPEPASYGLVIAALLAGLVIFRIRRKRIS